MNATKSSPDELREGLAFALLPGIGCVAYRAAVEKDGHASVSFRGVALGGAAPEALGRADALLARAAGAGARIVLLGDTDYPEALRDLPDPPAFYFAIGAHDLLAGRRIGIVGTRHSSASGERIAHRIAELAAQAGAVIVSGMALGIDAAAHRGALDAGGGTIAVLGGGADLPYPPTHAVLHRRITSAGLVLSEAPVGTRPVKGAFPRRNRIIAALSDLLVVIEAGDRSGALITANHALDLGRPIAAVPGPIDSPRHVGSNQLLSSGAQFIAAPEDVLAMAGLTGKPRTPPPLPDEAPPPVDALDGSEVALLQAVQSGASDAEGLARVTRLPAREIAVALSSLELRGHVRVEAGGGIALARVASPSAHLAP